MTSTLRNVLIAAVMVVGVGGLVFAQKQSAPVTTEGTAAPSTPMTIASVAAHNSRTDCWSVINGGVYDLTSWIPKHPGGEQAILGLCGTDGSARFNGQHGGAAQQAAILAGFKIGEVGGAAGAAPAAVTAPAATGDDNDGSGRGRGRGGRDDS